ncbi:hypothetical protein J6590_074237 [Homalodisca vitripennis]|nr:hypothetical protein J6590_074237 [Homalodisca vitripennis]
MIYSLARLLEHNGTIYQWGDIQLESHAEEVISERGQAGVLIAHLSVARMRSRADVPADYNIGQGQARGTGRDCNVRECLVSDGRDIDQGHHPLGKRQHRSSIEILQQRQQTFNCEHLWQFKPGGRNNPVNNITRSCAVITWECRESKKEREIVDISSTAGDLTNRALANGNRHGRRKNLVSFTTLPSSKIIFKQRGIIKQNKEESRYSTRLMVLIKSERVTDRIRTCAISNSNSKSTILDHSAIPTKRTFDLISTILKMEIRIGFTCVSIPRRTRVSQRRAMINIKIHLSLVNSKHASGTPKRATRREMETCCKSECRKRQSIFTADNILSTRRAVINRSARSGGQSRAGSVFSESTHTPASRLSLCPNLLMLSPRYIMCELRNVCRDLAHRPINYYDLTHAALWSLSLRCLQLTMDCYNTATGAFEYTIFDSPITSPLTAELIAVYGRSTLKLLTLVKYNVATNRRNPVRQINETVITAVTLINRDAGYY